MCDRDSEKAGEGGRENELANRANRAGATEREQLVWNRGFCGLSSSRKHGGEWGEWQGEDTERKWLGEGEAEGSGLWPGVGCQSAHSYWQRS